jgi:DNA-binding NarL/FixJ family response regulator
MTRVVVVDDQSLVRSGLELVLESRGFEVVGSAADGREAVDVVRRTEPDVVLMDIRMPVMDGIEATRRVIAGSPAPPRVLVLTTFDLDEYVFAALRAGASGFLLKDTPRAGLLAAVRAVAVGDVLLSPVVTRRLVERFARRPESGAAKAAWGALSPREHDVAVLVARGLSNAEIAAQLVVSEATVKSHVAHVLTKTGLRDRVQVVVRAYETGLVEPGDHPAT